MNVERIDGKPNVTQGVIVLVDGMESTVETTWGQGAHKAFKLSDGRVILDLDKLVQSGKAQICGKPIAEVKLPAISWSPAKKTDK